MPFLSATGAAAGKPDSGRCALTSFEPRHSREHQPADTSLESQPNLGRQALQEPTGRRLNATGTPRNAPPVSIRHFGVCFLQTKTIEIEFEPVSLLPTSRDHPSTGSVRRQAHAVSPARSGTATHLATGAPHRSRFGPKHRFAASRAPLYTPGHWAALPGGYVSLRLGQQTASLLGLASAIFRARRRCPS
jgi:hypothetical protein